MELRLKDHGVTLNIAVWKEDGDIIPAYALDACGLGPYHRGSTQIASLLGFFGSWFIDRSNARYTFRKKGVIRIIQVGIVNR